MPTDNDISATMDERTTMESTNTNLPETPTQRFSPQGFADVDWNGTADTGHVPESNKPEEAELDSRDKPHLFSSGGSRRRRHHFTTYRYPAIDLLPERAVFRLRPPLEARTRLRPYRNYEEPLPNEASKETRLYAITPMDDEFAMTAPNPHSAIDLARESLVNAMNRVSRYRGKTVLSLCNFTLDGREERIVHRSTVFWVGSVMEEQNYRFTIGQWNQIPRLATVGLPTQPTSQHGQDPNLVWWRDLEALPGVVRWYEDTTPAELFGGSLTFVDIASFGTDRHDRECPVCLEEYGEELPVIVPCGSEHVVGHNCLLDHVQHPANRFCPMDRRPLQFPDHNSPLAFNSLGHWEFSHRRLDTIWDAVVRSRRTLKIDAELTMRDLRALVLVAQEFHKREMPYNPATYEETGVMMQVVEMVLMPYHRLLLFPQELFTRLRRAVIGTLIWDDNKPMRGEDLPVAPGFYTFLSQTLRRLILLSVFRHQEWLDWLWRNDQKHD
ncbi:hypothetical protein H2201_006916 [Coniosporium apollinis]|uniref:RING-type domain-containing protein n=1 Tax=Coniosporium apollinis TaxID=61459 RepID=A0ABQ9NKI4_9PEZI|nr:hypothetical protein H2201_006916 [Coniosporium apollinis]